MNGPKHSPGYPRFRSYSSYGFAVKNQVLWPRQFDDLFLYSYYCFDVKTKSSDDRKQGILTCIQVIFLQKTYKTGIKGLIKNPKSKSKQTAFIKRNCDRSFSFTSEIKTFYRLNKMIKALWSPLFILIFSKSIK